MSERRQRWALSKVLAWRRRWRSRRGSGGDAQATPGGPAISKTSQTFAEAFSEATNRDLAMYGGRTLLSGEPAVTAVMDGYPEDHDFSEEHTMDPHNDGPTRTLDAIRAGGHQLVIRTRQQIAAALDALDEGDFNATSKKLTDAGLAAGNLANAQTYIAVAEGSRLIPAANVEAGMTLTDVGEVCEVEVEDCPVCGRHINIKIGDHDVKFHGDQEVYVVNDE